MCRCEKVLRDNLENFKLKSSEVMFSVSTDFGF